MNIPKAITNKKIGETYRTSRRSVTDGVLPSSHDMLPTDTVLCESLGLHSSASLNEKLRISIEKGMLFCVIYEPCSLFLLDKDKSENYFFFLLDHLLKLSLGLDDGQVAGDVDQRLCNTVISVGSIKDAYLMIDPSTVDGVLCNSIRRIECLFIPYEHVAKRVLLLSSVPFLELPTLSGCAVAEYIRYDRIAYYTMDDDSFYCVRRICNVMRQPSNNQAVFSVFPSWNVLPCQLLFDDLSPAVALSRLPFAVHVVYIDESQSHREYLSVFFRCCSNVRLRCVPTAAEAIPFPAQSIVLVSHPDDNDGVLSNAVATIRRQTSVAGVSVLVYMDRRHSIDKADGVFRTFGTGNEVASHILHMLMLKYNGVLFGQRGFQSF